MKETEAIANLAERSSGIDIVGNIPWGSHFCQLYRTKQDLLDIAVPYFKAGLENGEFCVWVTSEFLNNNEAKAAMGKAVPGFPEYFDSGQMEIISRGEWYFKDGKFAMNRVLRSWFEKYGQGLAMGFCGMRVSGDHFWPESEKSRSDFSEYESNISGAIRGKNILALCVYPQDKCAAAEIIDMVKNLEFALIKRAGGWETIEGLGHKKTQEALRESEKRYHKLFDTMAEGSALSEIILGKDGRPIDYRFIDVNPAFEKFTGLTRREIVGKLRRQVPIILNTSSFEAYARVALTGKPEYFENYNKTLGKYYRVNVYSPEPMRFVSVFTDITERKLAENKLNKLNRILKSLSDANQALINIDDEKKYLQKICDIIIGDCGYSMVWIGYANNDEEKSVVPIACAGFENGYLEKLKITWSGTERGQGPTGTSIRTGKPCGCSNMLTDPFFAPWRDEAAARGYASSLALPLVHGDDVFGVITIYSRQPDEFLKDEVELLQKLADDVAKGIFSIRLEAAKKRVVFEEKSEAGVRVLVCFFAGYRATVYKTLSSIIANNLLGEL